MVGVVVASFIAEKICDDVLAYVMEIMILYSPDVLRIPLWDRRALDTMLLYGSRHSFGVLSCLYIYSANTFVRNLLHTHRLAHHALSANHLVYESPQR